MEPLILSKKYLLSSAKKKIKDLDLLVKKNQATLKLLIRINKIKSRKSE